MSPFEECRRCTLPSHHPLAHVDEEGVCRPCRLAEQEDAARAEASAHELETVLREARGDGEDDAVVACSGGKDSSFTLLQLARRTDLRLVAVTVDNGFLSDHALENAARAAEAAAARHVVLRPPREHMVRLFRDGISGRPPVETRQGRASAVCNTCMRVVKLLCVAEGLSRGAALLVWGWSPGQAPRHSALYRPPRRMLEQMVDHSRREILARLGEGAQSWLPPEGLVDAGAGPRFVHPLAFWDYDEKHMRGELRRIGWIEPEDVDAHSTNCRLNALGNHVHQCRHGYHPYALEIAGLVRHHWLTPAEAHRRLDQPPPEGLVAEVARELELTDELRVELGLSDRSST